MARSGQAPATKRNGRAKQSGKRVATQPDRPAEAGTRGQLEYAYQRLKDAIANGIYMPNQRLIEAEVTQALGVSRTTLRAALIRLHQEGLIEIEVNRGARVRAFGLDEAVEILLVREVLEGLAAVLAIEKATEDDLV